MQSWHVFRAIIFSETNDSTCSSTVAGPNCNGTGAQDGSGRSLLDDNSDCLWEQTPIAYRANGA